MSMACDVLMAIAASGGRVERRQFIRLLKSVGIEAGGSVGSLRSELTRRRLIRTVVELTSEGRALLARSKAGRELLSKLDAERTCPHGREAGADGEITPLASDSNMQWPPITG